MRFISKTDSYARQLTKATLIVQGLDDHLISPKAVARLFRYIPSRDKTFLIAGKGEHIILEEGRFSSPLAERLIGWLKDARTQPPTALIEVIDNATLTPEETQRLEALRRIAKAR